MIEYVGLAVAFLVVAALIGAILFAISGRS